MSDATTPVILSRRPHADRPLSRRSLRLYGAPARRHGHPRGRRPGRGRSGGGRRSDHGPGGPGRLGTGPGAPGADPCRSPRRHPRAHHQQGLRLRAQGRDARLAGHQGGRRRVHRGGRAGGDVERAALRLWHAGRDQGRQPDHGRRHDPRRAVGLVRLLPHGRVRGVHRGQGRREPGRPGRASPTRATGRRWPPPRRASSRRRSCRCRCPGRAARRRSSADESPRQGHQPRHPGQAQARLPEGRRDGHRRQRARA